MQKKSENVRHILPLSGGKDSAALAVYLKDKIPNLEYVFLDTGHELPETYEFLERMRAMLGIRIQRVTSTQSFEEILFKKGNYLPSPQKRWCTEELKIKPFEVYIGKDRAYSYLGIRADEDRDGYISIKHNIIPRYPFIEDGLILNDIESLLLSSGLGFPEYYKWRSRSGCYFCFFQQRIEWLNLYKHHPDLFLKAMTFEKNDPKTGRQFTWCQDESLAELLKRSESIYKDPTLALKKKGGRKKISRLVDLLDDSNFSCVICE